jgi:hypothetical protein
MMPISRQIAIESFFGSSLISVTIYRFFRIGHYLGIYEHPPNPLKGGIYKESPLKGIVDVQWLK